MKCKWDSIIIALHEHPVNANEHHQYVDHAQLPLITLIDVEDHLSTKLQELEMCSLTKEIYDDMALLLNGCYNSVYLHIYIEN